MGWLLDPFSHAFMQRALVTGVLVVVVTSLVGTWVVIRGMSFMGDALAHGVLPGIALAFVLGIDPAFGAIAGALVMSAGIGLVHRKGGLREDTGIGLLFVGMLALGVILISRLPTFASDLTGVLFGDVLGIRTADVWLAAGAAAATVAAVVALYRPFLALSFNEEKAQVLGLAPALAHFVLLALLTLAIVASFRAVGTLLVFALLIAPPATASLVVRRVPSMMAAAIAFGAASVAAGLLVSWHAATAAGATVAGTSVALFFCVLTARRLVRRRAAPGG